MTPTEATVAQVFRLIAEIRADRAALSIRTDEARAFFRPSPSPEHTAAIALTLDRIYTTLEAVLERIARTLEGGPPAGEDWHRALVDNAGLPIPHVRPAILSQESIVIASRLRRFRHFLRHAYAAPLDSGRIAVLAQAWMDNAARVQTDLDAFGLFLEKMADSAAGDSG